MENFYDEFSKSLAVSVPRRESLRRMGAVFAGAVLGQLGLGTAWGKGFDPCKAFCRCGNKTQQNACLAACRNCNSNPTRLCGSCGSGYACTDFANDVENCGTCGTRCDLTGPYEYGACVDGACVYECVDGALDCGDGICTYLGSDPNNCGACGNICGTGTTCRNGTCQPNTCIPNCPTNWCGGDGCGGECACPNGFVCMGDGLNMCVPVNDCVFPFIMCGGGCVDPTSDPYNCGGCGNVCPSGFFCSSGACWDPICQFVEC